MLQPVVVKPFLFSSALLLILLINILMIIKTRKKMDCNLYG